MVDMFSKFRFNFPWFSRNYNSAMDNIIDEISELCFDFADNIRHSSSQQDIKRLCLKHLKTVSALPRNNLKLPDFKPGLEWVNVTEPLTLQQHLRGKIVILDFFTYCCINCMHILPDLKRLEQEISVKDGLVVIGVHSAKFSNERKTVNIESAVRRYDVTHPVVNDNVEAMWKALQVHCWPTLYVLGPNAEPLLVLQGEGHYNTLKIFVLAAIEFFKETGDLSDSPIPQIMAYSAPKHTSMLLYPGKITVSKDGSLLAISDSAHHRVLVTSPTGVIKFEIGGNSHGLTDGTFENAKFNSPQGITFCGTEKLFVADTENHCIREVNLIEKTVSTVVGIGIQGHDHAGGKEGTRQAISSPWDLCLVKDILFIAMAGTHQIWAYFFNDTVLWKRSYKSGTCAAVVGSGREENRNNNYPSAAGLAQPSGLSYDGKSLLFFADSESSAIRAVNIENGSVIAIVGGAMDPRNLFAFGDKDGTGIDAKLQHPLGVAWSFFDESLYVADTYNHKIKKIERSSKKCFTVGDYNNKKLSEPGGIYAYQDKLYIADTNNHAIRMLSIPNYSWSEFNIELQKSDLKNSEVFHSSSVNVNSSDSSLNLEINLSLPKNCSLTKEAPSKWMLYLPGNKILTNDENFSLNPKWNLKISAKSKERTLKAVSRLFLCIEDKCTVKELTFLILLIFDDNASKNAQHKIIVDYNC